MKSGAAFVLAVLVCLACRPESPAPETQTSPAGSPTPAAATPVLPAATPSPAAAEQAGNIAAGCRPAAHVLCPVDEGVSDGTFSSFRAEMLSAVRRKDSAALMAMVDPEIRTSFGDGGGLAEFRSQWKPESPNSQLWTELESLLTLGGKFLGEGESRSFWAPYVYSAWPDPYDSFMHVAAVKADVPIHARADGASEVKARVSWEILEVGEPSTDAPEGWTKVTRNGGIIGWVRSGDVRSPIGYRAGFSRKGDRWRMDALVAGD